MDVLIVLSMIGTYVVGVVVGKNWEFFTREED